MSEIKFEPDAGDSPGAPEKVKRLPGVTRRTLRLGGKLRRLAQGEAARILTLSERSESKGCGESQSPSKRAGGSAGAAAARRLAVRRRRAGLRRGRGRLVLAGAHAAHRETAGRHAARGGRRWRLGSGRLRRRLDVADHDIAERTRDERVAHARERAEAFDGARDRVRPRRPAFAFVASAHEEDDVVAVLGCVARVVARRVPVT